MMDNILQERYKRILQIGGRLLKESSKVQNFKRPKLPLKLYEFEGCPFCKKVREIISYLDLDVEMYPCPKGGQRFRSLVVEKAGKAQFPYLVDPNTGIEMFESDDIVRYLCKEYGDGKVPFASNLPLGLTLITLVFASMMRTSKGLLASPSRSPKQALVLYGYEGSPFTKLARERLCELEIPYLYKNVARGSPKRQALFEDWGKFSVPYIEDPNTKIAMFESVEIVKYLQATYGD
eukprot:TRINITY_DN73304_c0_g1_i3.p2 TRINITY_DN73304_c0_g1~~TRINITY_DN73304_c0_g1_i3.p2  ORF type:complete len:235 (-),score=26.06 TRINITY_DN73304_c0_g1_i3:188-892(-)